ncbi:uncharacterized protein LOC117175789 [Belonocnema kinseyi]|uniref:uncharacterized protein LOC117175789 n=1 Tax=Belonocnema kinseyi TaxID=2817044 RepID=UPI00143D8936|nr:uncharacterized protein LOC117175789 [Belonocnema kinseyi]
MLSFSGDILASEDGSMNSEKIIGSVDIANDTLIRKIRTANYAIYNYNHWIRDYAADQGYRAAAFLLPLGSIFVLTLVVLLMVLFKRCPQLVAAVVAGILGTIIIFTILVTVNHPAVYQ